jgi:hypothetical protein
MMVIVLYHKDEADDGVAAACVDCECLLTVTLAQGDASELISRPTLLSFFMF